LLRSGVDPRAGRKTRAVAPPPKRTIPTFAEAAARLIAEREKEWRDGAKGSSYKHWDQMLRTHLPQWFLELPVNLIEPEHVLGVLKPILERAPGTGFRDRIKIEQAIEFVRGSKDVYPNPAAWSGWLKTRLRGKVGSYKTTRTGERVECGNQPSLPFAQVSAFFTRLLESPSVSAQALRLIILSGVRPSEGCEMPWSEYRPAFEDPIDGFCGPCWVIPGPRMKMKRDHRIPLSEPALAVLRERERVRQPGDVYVFPGKKTGRPITIGALRFVIRKGFGVQFGDFTPHGFRATFSTWCQSNGIAHDLCEHALAHEVGNRVARAYARGDQLRSTAGDGAFAFVGLVPGMTTDIAFSMKSAPM
jgi:integrase